LLSAPQSITLVNIHDLADKKVSLSFNMFGELKILFLVNAQLLWESLKMPVWLNCNENEKNKHIK
jgi:hypothetical protein